MSDQNYSWGELYETLKEMEEKGDCHEDQELEKTCNLIASLEKTTTMRAAKKLIKNTIISDYELQRINSPCLEGLLPTGTEKDSILALVKLPEGVRYMDTFKFYMKRITAYNNFFEICKYGTKEMIELLMNKNICRHDLDLGLSAAICMNRSDIVQFFKEKGIETSYTRYVNMWNNIYSRNIPDITPYYYFIDL